MGNLPRKAVLRGRPHELRFLLSNPDPAQQQELAVDPHDDPQGEQHNDLQQGTADVHPEGERDVGRNAKTRTAVGTSSMATGVPIQFAFLPTALLKEVPPQAVADEFRHQPELGEFNLAFHPPVQLGKAHRDAMDRKGVDLKPGVVKEIGEFGIGQLLAAGPIIIPPTASYRNR